MNYLETLLVTEPGTLPLGSVVDAYKELRDIRLMMAKEVEAVEAVERKYKEHLIQNIGKSDSAGVFGLKYKAKITTKSVPIVGPDGWPKLHEFIYNNGRFDLLQKRIADGAVTAMLEAGEKIPGIETMQKVDVSVTKV